MSFFDKLFGKKKPAPQPAEKAELPLPATPPTDPAQDPNMIKVFDAYGREMFITRQEWRTNVLAGTIQKNWNNPDQLYSIIVGSLNDGFRSDVVVAAEHLYEIDPQRLRSAGIWGIILMEEGRLNEAEKVFRCFTEKYGEQGVIFTNLAKVYSKRKEDSKAEELLWHGLELDPNQDNGLGWYWASAKEKKGEAAATDVLRRIAALPGSWRAQLWLARHALESKNLEQALSFYHEALSCAGNPIPTDFLMQMSGDLGNHAHLPELLNVTEPHFDVAVHGLQVGNNLIKAHLDLGQIDAAQTILDQLYGQKRPDWGPNLKYWDAEITKTRNSTANALSQGPLKMAMLSIEGPVWLKPSSPAAELFPAKSQKSPVVCFLGSSAIIATNSKRVEMQLADAPGRMSRALPLFLAEQVDFNTQAEVKTLIPWITEERSGFVLSRVPWTDEDAANYARQGEIKGDYVIITHLLTQTEPWQAELKLVRTIDAKLLATHSVSFPSTNPELGIPDLARQLLSLLSQHAEVGILTPPNTYQVPDGIKFPYYLLRLEQLLAVRCVAMDGVSYGLHGERDIIDGNIQQCLDYPKNVSTRILLAQTLLVMKKARPQIIPEFEDKVAQLQKEQPLSEPAQSVVQRLFDEALGL